LHALQVADLAEQLTQAGHTVSPLHEHMQQLAYQLHLRAFRAGSSSFIVTTDPLSLFHFGVGQVAANINYDLPPLAELYLHRLGKFGRFGSKTVGISFVTQEDRHLLQQFEQELGCSIPELPADGGGLQDWA
jgi:superfamily II DNA/RNA helicase